MTPKRIGETSYKNTALGIISRSALIPLEIEGMKRVWDAVQLERQKHRIAITPVRIRRLHAVAFGWIFPDSGGVFRTVDVTVSNHEPPHFYLVPVLMEEYCRDLKTRLMHIPSMQDDSYVDDLVGFLVWVHHRFLWIHPFQDYNGRMARLLMNVLLLNLDLPPIELKVETTAGRTRYVRALQLADGGDYRGLERLIRSAIMESVSEV